MPPVAFAYGGDQQRHVFRRSKARLLAIISFALVFLYLLRRTLVAEPSSTGHDAYHHPTIRRRTVAIADLHGDLPHALNVLTMAGVITSPSQAHWKPSSDFFHDSQQTSQQRHGISRSDTILVSTGDIVDRGDDTIALYRLFERLRREAANQQISSSSQGQVKNCIGNHELMNALGDWRYVTPGDIQSFGGEMERRKMMSSEGWLGRLWLEHYNVSHSIDLLPPEQVRVARDLPSEYRLPRASFVHGGIHPSWAATGLDHINTVGQSLLSKALTEASLSGHGLPKNVTQEERAIYAEQGPFWYRGYAYEEDKEACSLAAQAADSLQVDYLVQGHTPHLQGFVHRCKPKPILHLIDTGISRAYGGEQSALVFEVELKWHGSEEASKGHWKETTRLIALYKGRRPKTIYTLERKIDNDP